MRAKYGITWVAPGGLEGTSGLAWDFVQANDEAPLFRAAASSWHARGARSCRLSFRVTRFFASEAEAIAFKAEHQAELAGQADLQLFADGAADNDPSAEVLDAVVESVRSLRQIGCALELEYSFRGGVATLPP